MLLNSNRLTKIKELTNKKLQQVISAVIVIGLLGWFAYSMFLKPESGMHLIIESNEVAGLEPDNAVVVQGLTVGRVHEMRLKNDFSGKVIIDVLLDKTDLKMPKDSTFAVITDADLMGTKQLDLIFSNNDCTNCLEGFDTIKSQLGSYFDTEINELEPLMQLIEQTYETLDTAVKSWKEQNLGDYNSKARQAERDIKEMMTNFTTATDGAMTLMKTTTASFDRISEDAAVVMANFEGESIKQIESNVAIIQSNLKGANFDQTSKKVEVALNQWNSTLEEITQTQKLFAAVVKKLEADQTGSLAQILNDPRFQSEETDPNAPATAINLNYSALLKDIRLHPEKYTYFLKRDKKEK